VLTGIHPLLTGELLAHLDAMGHSDAVVLADAHFPASRVGHRVAESAGVTSPALLAAVRTVLPLDDAPAIDLMATPDDNRLPVQEELVAAAGVSWGDVRMLDRYGFYDVAAQAYLVIRTGETRSYGNVILRKGLVQGANAAPSHAQVRGGANGGDGQ
jgi:L-fucose mutarotase